MEEVAIGVNVEFLGQDVGFGGTYSFEEGDVGVEYGAGGCDGLGVLMGEAFPLQGGTDVLMVGVGEENNGVDGRVEGMVHCCHGLFVGEVVGVADAAEYELSAELVAEVDSHAGIGEGLDTGFVGEALADALQTFLGAEHIVLVGIHPDGDVELVEERQGTAHNGLMS